MVGIAIGIGSVIALVTVGQIVQNEALVQFKELGTDIITISKDWGGGGSGKHSVSKITPDLAEEIPELCPAIKMVAPYNILYEEMFYAGKRNYVSALGVTEEFAVLNKLKVVEGRFISDLDMLMPFCVISQEVRQTLAEAGMTKFVGSSIYYKKQKVYDLRSDGRRGHGRNAPVRNG